MLSLNYSNFQFNSVARFKDDYLLASTLWSLVLEVAVITAATLTLN